MRTAFINELMTLAEQDKRIVLLTADVGFSVFERFKEKYPNRFYNVGIAEQNLIGVAAGLALRGKKPYAYSIVPFLTMRACEQVRVDVCYHNLDVKLIGVGGGFAYGLLGPTHHAIEDIAITRSFPNMNVIAPGDPYEAKNAVSKSYLNNNPTYIRLSRNNEPTIYRFTSDDIFEVGKAICMRKGSGIAILSTGNMLEQASLLSEKLSEKEINHALFSFHTIKPIDKETLRTVFYEFDYVITMEEHNIFGGFYSVVMEEYGMGMIRDYRVKKIIPFAINDTYSHYVGGQDCLRKQYKIDNGSILEKLNAFIS
jgi:transketolase